MFTGPSGIEGLHLPRAAGEVPESGAPHLKVSDSLSAVPAVDA